MREAKVVEKSSGSDTVIKFRCWPPQKNWTSRSWNGVESDGLYAYSPGLRRKKNASPIVSARH